LPGEGGDLEAPCVALLSRAPRPRIVTRAAAFRGQVVTFGIEHAADVRASPSSIAASTDQRPGDDGVDGGGATPLVGRGNLANILAATAVAGFGVPLPTSWPRPPVCVPRPSRRSRAAGRRSHGHRRQRCEPDGHRSPRRAGQRDGDAAHRGHRRDARTGETPISTRTSAAPRPGPASTA
jgi:hypothetical protein